MKKFLLVMSICGICGGLFAEGRDLSVNSDKTGERPPLWKPNHTWVKNPGAATFKIVETPDHIDGGKGIYWKANEKEKAPENLGVHIRLVPTPGKSYKATFWAKSTEPSTLMVSLYGWQKGMKKEFQVYKYFKVMPDWKQFEFTYTVPSAEADPVFAKKPGYNFCMDFRRGKNKDLIFKDMKIEELE